MNIWSAYLAYRLIELLSKPFKEWNACKLGIIDENGNTIKQPVLTDEKQAFGLFEKIIRNLKQVVTKTIGPSKAAAILSIIYLIKEHNEDVAKVVLNYCLKENVELQEYLRFSNRLQESFENVWTGKDNSVIQKGDYILNGKKIQFKEDLMPVDKFVGIFIYKCDNTIFTKEELQ